LVRRLLKVGRRLAVGAPRTLELQRIRIPHRHAVVAVAVSRDQLVRLRIEADLRHAADVVVVHAALAAVGRANLSEILAVLREFQDEAVVIGALTGRGDAGLWSICSAGGWCRATCRRRRELRGAARSRTRLTGTVRTKPDVALAIHGDAVVRR